MSQTAKRIKTMAFKRKKIAVLTGAGVSAESGMDTFRDKGGMWDNYDPQVVASIDGWRADKKLLLDFYNHLRTGLKDKHPNKAHELIASLEKDYSVTVITQNVDNLHERAGSTNIIHLHGELTKVRPEHGVYDRTASEAEVFDIGYTEIGLGDCAPNGQQLRPHIVWFGEAVPKIEKAIEAVEAADIMLIVGTSLSVYPAAGLYRYASMDTPIYLIDPKDVQVYDSRITHIKAVASKGMEEFISLISK